MKRLLHIALHAYFLIVVIVVETAPWELLTGGLLAAVLVEVLMFALERQEVEADELR